MPTVDEIAEALTHAEVRRTARANLRSKFGRMQLVTFREGEPHIGPALACQHPSRAEQNAALRLVGTGIPIYRAGSMSRVVRDRATEDFDAALGSYTTMHGDLARGSLQLRPERGGESPEQRK